MRGLDVAINPRMDDRFRENSAHTRQSPPYSGLDLSHFFGKSFLRWSLLARQRSTTLEKHPDLGPLFDDVARAKSAEELKEHLDTCVL